MMEHKDTDGRREVGMQPPNIDVGDQTRERDLVLPPNLLQAVPKGILKADASFMTRDYDRPFDDCGIHRHLLCWGMRLNLTPGMKPPFAPRTPYEMMTHYY
jgi:hypothetical protein